MGQFDQTARQAAKLDGPPFFVWLCRHCESPPPVVFDHWDDTRRLVWPGGPERTDDLVAVLRRTDVPDRFVYAIVEFETEPERFIFQRLGVYGLLLSTEVALPPGSEDEPPVATFLVNLTRERPTAGLALPLPGTPNGIWVKPVVANLRQDQAAATLAEIAGGRTGFCILPWLPLMAGGGEPALIEEWKRVALQEPDPQRRAMYRDLALVFAELTRELINWQKSLEGWEMKESVYISGWMHEGEIRGELRKQRDYLVKLLHSRLPAEMPEAVRLAIEGTNDPATLDRWYDAALTADSWDAFRAAMKAT